MLIRASLVVGLSLLSASAFAQEEYRLPPPPPPPANIRMPPPLSTTQPLIQVQLPPPTLLPRKPDRPTYCDTHKGDKQNCPD